MSEYELVGNHQVVLFGKDIRAKMLTGLDVLACAVSATLGPRGRNVAITRGKGGKVHLTKDGVTVAGAIVREDNAENMGVEFVKEVSKKACNEAGDGTTTATVLAHAIVNKAIKRINNVATANPVAMQRGIQFASDKLQAKLNENSLECTAREQMIRVATISANGDEEIGTVAGDAVYDAGEYGLVKVEPYKGSKDIIVAENGLVLENGMVSASFMNNSKDKTRDMSDVYLIIIDGALNNIDPYKDLIATIPTDAHVLIVADEFDDSLVSAIAVTNSANDSFRNPKSRRSVTAPSIGIVVSSAYGKRRKEMLRDLAIYTGGSVTGDEGDILPEDLKIEDCGRATSVTLHERNGLVISNHGDANLIEERIQMLRTHHANPAISEYDRTRIKERIGLLAGKVATIKVGADTDIGMRERKDRYDDAVCAVRSARERGILAGGGTALIAAAAQLPALEANMYDVDFLEGYKAVLDAIEAPAITISRNAGLDGSEIAKSIREQIIKDVALTGKSNYGYNAATGEFGDMVAMDVLDPAKVTCSAIKYAASIAGSLITTEVGVIG